MLATTESNLESLGKHIESRFTDELPVVPVEKFAGLLDLKNLQGDSTGYIKVCGGDRIEKGSSLSIDMMPGMRYFNIHIIPESSYRVPRFLFEGMLTKWGSQVSMDLFPDIDAQMDVDYLIEEFTDVNEIYNSARSDPDVKFEASRQLHMRAFSSPFFLCAFDVDEDKLPRLEEYADGYFSEWKRMLESAPKLEPDSADARRIRRAHIAKTIIRQDPDRDKVVAVYGEACTQAIEAASML